MPRGDQLTRQWMLVRLLSSRGGRTLAQLQAELGVGKRTVQRLEPADCKPLIYPLTNTSDYGNVNRFCCSRLTVWRDQLLKYA